MEYDKIDQALIDLYLTVKQSRMNKNGSRSIQSAIHERDTIRPSGKTGYGKLTEDKYKPAANICPHGKRYACGTCKKSYPRLNLDKRPRNS